MVQLSQVEPTNSVEVTPVDKVMEWEFLNMFLQDMFLVKVMFMPNTQAGSTRRVSFQAVLFPEIKSRVAQSQEGRFLVAKSQQDNILEVNTQLDNTLQASILQDLGAWLLGVNILQDLEVNIPEELEANILQDLEINILEDLEANTPLDLEANTREELYNTRAVSTQDQVNTQDQELDTFLAVRVNMPLAIQQGKVNTPGLVNTFLEVNRLEDNLSVLVNMYPVANTLQVNKEQANMVQDSKLVDTRELMDQV